MTIRLRVLALAALLAVVRAALRSLRTPSRRRSRSPPRSTATASSILIRSTLLALDQANKTGNYTVLRDLGAPGFQATNNPAQLGDIFANLRRERIDLSGVAVLRAATDLLPADRKPTA